MLCAREPRIAVAEMLLCAVIQALNRAKANIIEAFTSSTPTFGVMWSFDTFKWSSTRSKKAGSFFVAMAFIFQLCILHFRGSGAAYACAKALNTCGAKVAIFEQYLPKCALFLAR